MKYSIYNKIVPYKDDYLIYNQVTGALILVNKDGLKEIEELFDDSKNELLFEKFKDLGFIVEDEEERLKLRKIYEDKTKNHLFKHLYITVTDTCNLGCHYCFEEKNQWIKMSLETQENIKVFTEKFLKQTETKIFGVGWYGGEPTLHMKAIENLSSFFKKLCEDMQITFVQSMITNGTTFNDAICNKLIELDIKRVQITIDGFKEDHDLSRPYLKDLKYEEMSPAQKKQVGKLNSSLLFPILGQKKSPPKSSYEEILKGVKNYVSKGGKVSLRMNVNEETIDRAFMLLNDLLNNNLLKENEKGGIVSAYANPIFEGGCSNASSMGMSSFAKKIEKIENWYKQNNMKYLSYSRLKFSGETCTANRKFEFIINPDGTLTKCTHHVGMKDKVIGDVKDLNPNPESMNIKENTFNKFNPFEDEECYNCEVLPMCMGGCKANNKVGENKNYEAGCTVTRFRYEQDIINLYESTIKV